jgi:acyl carrier protein
VVLSFLRRIAPEADPGRIDPREPLRDQLDLDSMDFLNFLIGVHEARGVDIPEADYPRLSSLEAITEYLGQKKRTAS